MLVFVSVELTHTPDDYARVIIASLSYFTFLFGRQKDELFFELFFALNYEYLCGGRIETLRSYTLKHLSLKISNDFFQFSLKVQVPLEIIMKSQQNFKLWG